MSLVHAAHDVTVEDSTPPSGVAVGFNFMRTINWVTPSAPDYTANAFSTWPTSFSGSTSDVRAGWWDPGAGYIMPVNTVNMFDENNSLDNRLVGYVYTAGGSSFAWRIELPEGTYRVWVGGGYGNYANSQGVIVNDGLTAGNQTERINMAAMANATGWHDINGDARKTEATWVSEYATKFATAQVTDRGADATGLDFRITYSGNIYFCHLRVQQQ